MIAYCARLRQLAATCEFADVDKEIKSQIIQFCTSNRLRRKALKDAMMTLQNLLDEARAMEVSEMQAKEIENSSDMNVIGRKIKSKPLQQKEHKKKGRCFNCGGEWPHDRKSGCPARTRRWNQCQKYGHYAKCCRSSQENNNQVRMINK